MTRTASPTAGWYPAPDGSSAQWWWDGTNWTQPTHLPGPTSATISGIAKLAFATRAFLIVCGAMSITTIGVEAFGIGAVSAFLGGDDSAIDHIDAYDRSTFAVSLLSTILLLTTGVLWMIWQFRVAKQVAGRTRRAPGWHAASWFVPIISWWFPYQNISDLWSALGRPRPPWLIAWWLLWITSNFVGQIVSRTYLAATDLEQFRIAMWMSIAGAALVLAAVPLAWLIVDRITRNLLERSTSPTRSPLT